MTEVMNAKRNNLAVLMFPWLAHGHISPFLELGKKLSKRNFNVHLCSTPANLTSIKKRMGEESSIQLVQLDLSTLSNLPPCYHTTNGLPPHLMDTLKTTFDMTKPDFSNILRAIKPDLLIYGFLRPWPAEASANLRIPTVQFTAISATMTSFMLHAFKYPSTKYPFSTIFYRDYENAQVGRSGDCVELRKAIESLEISNEVVLIKDVNEMEGKYTNYLCILSGGKIVHVGPLVHKTIFTKSVKLLRFSTFLLVRTETQGDGLRHLIAELNSEFSISYL